MEIYISCDQFYLQTRMVSDDVDEVNSILRSPTFTNDPFRSFTRMWTPIHELRSTRCFEAVIDRLHELGILHKALEYVVDTVSLENKRGTWGSLHYGMTPLHNIVKYSTFHYLHRFMKYPECWLATTEVAENGMTPASLCIYYDGMVPHPSGCSTAPMLEILLSNENPYLQLCLDAQTAEGENCIDRELRRVKEDCKSKGGEYSGFCEDIVANARSRNIKPIRV